jgi:hypothetical protein
MCDLTKIRHYLTRVFKHRSYVTISILVVSSVFVTVQVSVFVILPRSLVYMASNSEESICKSYVVGLQGGGPQASVREQTLRSAKSQKKFMMDGSN